MPEQSNRYPGAQPFSDDEISRKVFFGREGVATALADKILANRLIVVYGKSGLGKTSLLKAGVAPRLREEGYLPLFVRVNDAERGPFHGVLDGIGSEAARQGVEYVAGRFDSFWGFFKTAEFWRGDLLLTPVLILDQFEELFTLQTEERRLEFLDQLSYLTRGIRPPSADPAVYDDLGDHRQPIRILLSLREDYLGFLEEAAEHIPQILDARFRLTPLDMGAAEEAIVGPATVDDPGFGTRPFDLDGEALEAILEYLSQRRTATAMEARRYVEPFQLQLVCRRIEQVATARQRAGATSVTIGLDDVGGEAGLTKTLGSFYGDAIDTIRGGRARRASRRLCEEYLISAEGRRLSLERDEIRRQLGLSTETLDWLVSSRLLRSENRSDSKYYELSHDALVEPILTSKRRKSTITGWLGVVCGVVLFSLSLLIFGGMAAYLLTEVELSEDGYTRFGEILGMSILLAGVLALTGSSVVLLRGSARSLLRYRRARDAVSTGTDDGVEQRGGAFSGVTALMAGLGVMAFGLLVLFAMSLILLAAAYEGVRSAVQDFEFESYIARVSSNGVGVDTIVYLISAVALVLVAVRVMRWGVMRLARYPSRRRRASGAPARASPSVAAMVLAICRLVAGSVFLVAAVLTCAIALFVLECGYLSPGVIPAWFPEHWSDILVVDCAEESMDSIVAGLVLNIVVFLCLLYAGVRALRLGVRTLRTFKPRDEATQEKSAPRSAGISVGGD